MPNCQNSTIAIIDSGIGGLSILKQLIKKYNRGNYIYFADNLNMPYGNKNKVWLKKRIESIIKMLKEHYKVKQIIIACNTASTCLNLNSKSEIICMNFATNKTYLATNLTQMNLPNYNIIADKTLAKCIEKNILDKQKINIIIKQHIKRHKLDKLDELVLGCTHYELVKQCFQNNLKHCKIINNSEYLIKNNKFSFQSEDLNIAILTSKKSISLEKTIKKVLEII